MAIGRRRSRHRARFMTLAHQQLRQASLERCGPAGRETSSRKGFILDEPSCDLA